jgi:ABC-type transporter Mla subunit MlaD
MAQHKQLSWRKLRVGILVLAGLTTLAVAALCIRAERSRSSTFHLKIFLPQTYELKSGASIMLSGVPIGYVEDVRLVDKSIEALRDPRRTVAATLRVDRQDESFIRTDSVATLEIEGLLGRQYVEIPRGVAGPPVAENGEIRFEPPATTDLGQLLNRLVIAVQKKTSKAKPDMN